jgi:hypothetical protein
LIECIAIIIIIIIIIIMLPNQAIASTPSAPRPSGAEGRGSTAPLCLQLLPMHCHHGMIRETVASCVLLQLLLLHALKMQPVNQTSGQLQAYSGVAVAVGM